MTAQPKAEDRDKALFANLIMMLASSSMQQMGKIINPMTNKAEVDLETAQMTIDMIAMLQAKSQGNCDESEERMLKDLLSSLRMNFVETVEQEKKNKKEDTSLKKEIIEETEEIKNEKKDKKKDEKSPKYHKSYDS